MSTIKDASNKIKTNLAEITALFAETKELADKHGLDFSFTGPTRSMNNYYYGKKPSGDGGYWDNDVDDDGWRSSSHDC